MTLGEFKDQLALSVRHASGEQLHPRRNHDGTRNRRWSEARRKRANDKESVGRPRQDCMGSGGVVLVGRQGDDRNFFAQRHRSNRIRRGRRDHCGAVETRIENELRRRADFGNTPAVAGGDHKAQVPGGICFSCGVPGNTGIRLGSWRHRWR